MTSVPVVPALLVCAGGIYVDGARTLLRRLVAWRSAIRTVEWWYADDDELPADQRGALVQEFSTSLCLRLVDGARQAAQRHLDTGGSLRGVQLKALAVLATTLPVVLLVDADNALLQDPAGLTETRGFRETGCVFWPDFFRDGFSSDLQAAARCVGMEYAPPRSVGTPPPEPEWEWESGQVLLDRSRCAQALDLLWKLNAARHLVYQHVNGDKDLFRLAWNATSTPHHVAQHAPHCAGVRVASDSVWATAPVEAGKWSAEATPGRDLDAEFVGLGFIQRHPDTGEPLFHHSVFSKRLSVPFPSKGATQEWHPGSSVAGQVRRQSCGPQYVVYDE